MRVRSRRRPTTSAPLARSPLVAALFVRAQHEASTFRHDRIGTEHMLLALLADESGPAAQALRRLGLEAGSVRRDVRAIVGDGPPPGAAFDADALRALGIDLDAVRARVDASFGSGALDRAQRARGRCGAATFGVAPLLKRALERSAAEAAGEHRELTPGDLLVGLAQERDSLAARVLERHAITPELIQRALEGLDA